MTLHDAQQRIDAVWLELPTLTEHLTGAECLVRFEHLRDEIRGALEPDDADSIAARLDDLRGYFDRMALVA